MQELTQMQEYKEKIEKLNALNDVEILSAESDEFREYGRIRRGFDVSALIGYLEENTEIPECGNTYAASEPGLEAAAGAAPGAAALISEVYGDAPVQFGYCNGTHSTYNGFEYHKVPEIDIAATDMLLALGHSGDITEDLTYDPGKAKVFFIPRGTVVELYGDTLHLSPLRAEEAGYKSVVILPEYTNYPLDPGEDKAAKAAFKAGDRESGLLLRKNKWILAHPEWAPLLRQGARPGMLGLNKEILIAP